MSQPRPRAGRIVLSIVAFLGLTAGRARADENYFGFSYGSETLPRGRSEAYLWLTSRNGKGVGSYHAFDNFNELERGFTDRFQASLYVNTSAHRIRGNPEWRDNRSFGFEGVRTAFKYALSSPYKNAIGVAIYVEPEYSRRHKVSGQAVTELALETKLIFQKNFADDTVVTALNLTYEHEWEKEKKNAPGAESGFEQEIALEASAGISYRLRPKWFAGIEARTRSAYPDADLGHEEFRAWFLGPVLHYGGRKWWFTLTVLPQIHGRPPENSRTLFLGEHEKLEARLKVGYNF